MFQFVDGIVLQTHAYTSYNYQLSHQETNNILHLKKDKHLHKNISD